MQGEENRTETPDPLAVFVATHRRHLPVKRGKRFNAGEHIWLGGAGAERARQTVANSLGVTLRDDLFASVARRFSREPLQYGEIVALSGDFYESPEALFDEKPSAFPLLSGHADLDGLRAAFGAELDWIEDRESRRKARPYPDENICLAWSAKSYVELALRNADHFGWHNIRAYVRHHSEALSLAAEARGVENETFRRALYVNAFADHFLTDGFAAGHVRVPRAEIRDWSTQNGLGERVAGALSKILHDQDGHVDLRSLHGVVDESARAPEDGLAVEDSTGTRWFTRCDGELFLGSEDSVAVQRPVLAVASSVSELLYAWLRGELPRGVYEATTFVPFPRADAICLSKKFSSEMTKEERDTLWSSVAWYSKIPWISGLERAHLDALLEALPGLMAQFRARIAADVANERESIARIAPRYVAAYSQIA